MTVSTGATGPTNLTQSTGSSTTAVMSQDAVTKALNTKAPIETSGTWTPIPPAGFTIKNLSALYKIQEGLCWINAYGTIQKTGTPASGMFTLKGLPATCKMYAAGQVGYGGLGTLFGMASQPGVIVSTDNTIRFTKSTSGYAMNENVTTNAGFTYIFSAVYPIK